MRPCGAVTGAPRAFPVRGRAEAARPVVAGVITPPRMRAGGGSARRSLTALCAARRPRAPSAGDSAFRACPVRLTTGPGGFGLMPARVAAP